MGGDIMELRNYANECYMKVRRNDLQSDIEKGYISHEQANQYLAEYAYELKYPDKKRDKTVIQFITDAITSVDRKNSNDVLYDFFHAGYCYYFALMLKEAFGRGQICWCAPYGHICWQDENGVGYDIGGICDSECDFYIPVTYIKEGLLDFLHIPGKVFNASQEYIDNAIEMFKKDLIESYHVTLL